MWQVEIEVEAILVPVPEDVILILSKRPREWSEEVGKDER